MENGVIEKDELGRPIAADGYPTAGLAKIREAAAAAGVSVGLIYKLVHAGQLESVRIGRSLRIPYQALRERGMI